MSYDEVPRPLVEGHYHIRELIEAQEKRSADRTHHRNKEKELEERDTVLTDSKLVVVTDFWCDHCKIDFKSIAIRHIEKDWNCNQNIAFYKSKCRQCKTWCIRLITDKLKDGFWSKSRNIARDRGNAYADTVQPHMTGFNLLYGNKNK